MIISQFKLHTYLTIQINLSFVCTHSIVPTNERIFKRLVKIYCAKVKLFMNKSLPKQELPR